jgi:imidazolonepropionase-like amidohydrolase
MAGLIGHLLVHQVKEPVLAITGGTVIDGTGAPPLQNGVIIVRGKRIAFVGPKDKAVIPPEARQIDATGKWIIPGLIDMHVHLDEDLSPGAFVLFGVTSVRDVGSRLVTVQQLRSRAAKGETMPRIYWMGRNIDQGKPSWWGAVAVNGAEDVSSLLEDMNRQGVDGVKLYIRSGPKVTQAVIKEAHRRGWPVTAHLEDTRPIDAARFGIDNLEHISTLFVGIKKRPKTGKAGYAVGFTGVGEVDLAGPQIRNLIATLKKKHVAVTPTLTVSIMPVEGEKAAADIYKGWAKIPSGWSSYWKTDYWSFISTKGWSAGDYRTARQAGEKYRRLVGKLERTGVSIIAGTDTPAPWVLPGAGLVHELELLVQSGLSPMSALRAATGRAAEVLRKSADVGTIRVGRIADLVVLGADPLRDIHNLRKVEAVYQGGREVDLEKLRKSFAEALAPAKAGK